MVSLGRPSSQVGFQRFDGKDKKRVIELLFQNQNVVLFIYGGSDIESLDARKEEFKGVFEISQYYMQ